MKKDWKFSANAWKTNNTRLTNQIFKLLPMYENGEDWEKQKRTLVLEFKGYNEMFANNSSFMIMVAKLEALAFAEDKMIFRKLIFEAITALKEIQI